MYGDEYLDNAKKVASYDRTKIPSSNKDRCNPLYRVTKNEWTHDKNERGLNKTINQKREDTVIRLPIHEINAKLKLIQSIHTIRELRKYGTNRTTASEGADSS